VLDWLVFPVLGLAWAPVLVLLHEAGHALAAMALTDGEVSISLHGAGVLGGRVTYEPATLRRARGEVWIAAAGPAVTLVAAVVLWMVWLTSGADNFETVIGVGAWVATVQLACSALPIRYGAGLGGSGDSDGRVIWRILTGEPPGGIDRELRRLGKRERAARPGFVLVLVPIMVFSLWMDPLMTVGLIGLFGLALLMQRADKPG
jgi:hypothetical protein